MALAQILVVTVFSFSSAYAQAGPASDDRAIDVMTAWTSEKTLSKRAASLIRTLIVISDLDGEASGLTPDTIRLISEASRSITSDPVFETHLAKISSELKSDAASREAIQKLAAKHAPQIESATRSGRAYLWRVPIKNIWVKFFGDHNNELNFILPGLLMYATVGSSFIGFVVSEAIFGNACGLLLGAPAPLGLMLIWKVPETLIKAVGLVRSRLKTGKDFRRLKDSLLRNSGR